MKTCPVCDWLVHDEYWLFRHMRERHASKLSADWYDIMMDRLAPYWDKVEAKMKMGEARIVYDEMAMVVLGVLHDQLNGVQLDDQEEA